MSWTARESRRDQQAVAPLDDRQNHGRADPRHRPVPEPMVDGREDRPAIRMLNESFQAPGNCRS